MKKNKTVAYMLAATLLVGGTFLGTKALFTDSVDSIGELTISTGDVDIEAVVKQDWAIHRNGEETNTGTNNPKGMPNVVDNLKRGDYLTKTIEVTNEGTLNAIVRLVEDANVTGELPQGIEFNATFKDSNGNLIEGDRTFKPKEKATLELKIDVVGGGKHNQPKSLNNDTQEETLLDLKNAYVLSAEQQNPDGLPNPR